MSLRKKSFYFIISGLLASLLSGCFLSEAELEARKENSIDISGVYATSVDSDVDFEFKVINLLGTHDIFVELNRVNGLLKGERELLEKIKQLYGVSSDDIFDQPETLSLSGNFFQEIFSGGSNVSKDFGKSSEFRVCSDRTKYEANKEIIDPLTGTKTTAFSSGIYLGYCMSGTILKDDPDNIEKGTISLSVGYAYNKANDKYFSHTSPDLDLDLTYKARKVVEVTKTRPQTQTGTSPAPTAPELK